MLTSIPGTVSARLHTIASSIKNLIWLRGQITALKNNETLIEPSPENELDSKDRERLYQLIGNIRSAVAKGTIGAGISNSACTSILGFCRTATDILEEHVQLGDIATQTFQISGRGDINKCGSVLLFQPI